jgi:diaminohydroxyphosphoribosylaminopyrimidine deaminase / 5-amino-6-(5-phosphoribosylamino)uracil reductase
MNATENDIRWMQRAMELARQAEGLASPNPMTGAVMVWNGRAIGEGFHTYAGMDHAEIIALRKAGVAADEATLYVNLEPCSHVGRTGPCVEAIIAAGVKRVVAAMRDPNPRVAGRGFERLRAAGIEVVEGVGEAEARAMHEAFARWIMTRLPLVTMKSGMTLDGQLALGTHKKKSSATWITSEESRAEVHRMRHASDALLTGIGTVLADDPLMTDRSGLPRRRPLLRVILDSKLRIPVKSQIVRTAKNDVLVFTAQREGHPKVQALRAAGVEVVHAAEKRGRIELRAVMRELGKREILSVILEAGSELNGAALAAGIVDKMTLFIAPTIAGAQEVPLARAAIRKRRGLEQKALNLMNVSVARFGPDVRVQGYLRNPYSE